MVGTINSAAFFSVVARGGAHAGVAAPEPTDRPAPASEPGAGDAPPERSHVAAERARQATKARRAAIDGPAELTDREKAEVRHLKRQNASVRRHEMAHAAAGGPYTGAPNFDLERGPDGRYYAVDGHVSIDIAPAASLQGTVHKMEMIIRAALAPSEPSFQDVGVARMARRIKGQALSDLRAEEEVELEKARAAERDKQGDPGRFTLEDAQGEAVQRVGPLEAADAYARAGGGHARPAGQASTAGIVV